MIRREFSGGKRAYPMPMSEIERRWIAVRKQMRDRGIDALLMQSETLDSGGYIRWFTDIPTHSATTILFPLEDEIVYFSSASRSLKGLGEEYNNTVGSAQFAPYFRTVLCTMNFDAELVTDCIKKRGYRTVGLVNIGRMNASFYKYLVEELPDLEFVDATTIVDRIKIVKSDLEIEYIRETARLHDKVMYAAQALIYPGRLVGDVRNDMYHLACNLGAEGQMVQNLGAAPMGTPCFFGPFTEQNRRIDYGDQVLILLEANGPGGYYNELGRMFCLGDPCPELIRAWEAAKAAQLAAGAASVAGANPKDIFAASDKELVQRGYGPENRITGHGQGYDYMEPPALLDEETLLVEKNVVLAIHTSAVDEHANAFACDNYLVTENGGERLQKFPLELIQLY